MDAPALFLVAAVIALALTGLLLLFHAITIATALGVGLVCIAAVLIALWAVPGRRL